MTGHRRAGVFTRARTRLARAWRQFWWRRGGREAAARATGSGEASPRSARRPTHLLQVEDLILGAWVFGVEEVVRRWAGDPFALINDITPVDHGLGWGEILAQIPPVGWVVVGLFLFILLTRGPEDTDRDVALTRRWPMLNLALPVLSIYALVASGIQQAVFGSPDLKPGQEPPWPGPYVPGIVRRTAAVPLALLGDTLFRTSTAGLEQSLTYDMGLSSLPRLLVFTLLSVLPYSVCVAGPRIAAGAVLAWPPWIARFLVVAASAWVGAFWRTAG